MWNEHQVKSFRNFVSIVLRSVEFMIVDCAKEEVDLSVSEDAAFQGEEKLGE